MNGGFPWVREAGISVSNPHIQAGFAQSLADDHRFAHRFHQCRQMSTKWRLPTLVKAQLIDAALLVGRFGDMTIILTKSEGRRWIAGEPDWHGWPDPPRFVFFAVSQENIVWAARDFDVWLHSWTPELI